MAFLTTRLAVIRSSLMRISLRKLVCGFSEISKLVRPFKLLTGNLNVSYPIAETHRVSCNRLSGIWNSNEPMSFATAPILFSQIPIWAKLTPSPVSSSEIIPLINICWENKLKDIKEKIKGNIHFIHYKNKRLLQFNYLNDYNGPIIWL